MINEPLATPGQVATIWNLMRRLKIDHASFAPELEMRYGTGWIGRLTGSQAGDLIEILSLKLIGKEPPPFAGRQLDLFGEGQMSLFEREARL